MKRAVMLFERAEYWKSARRPLYGTRSTKSVRMLPSYQKIRGRNYARQKALPGLEKYLTMWRAQTLDLKMALLVSNYDHIYASFVDKIPPPGREKPV